jgi:membrane-bound ClpP family serine protease
VNELAPDGLVRVKGETWSATSLNGTVAAGTPVQVIRAGGVRLGVWGEPALPASPDTAPDTAPARDQEGSTPS